MVGTSRTPLLVGWSVSPVIASSGTDMTRDDFEDLGAKQKSIEPQTRLMPEVPVIARLDGRAFHTFTRKLPRPFSVDFRSAMVAAASELVDEFKPNVAYTQSDEISLCWTNLEMFDRREQKLASLLASCATAAFNDALRERLPEYKKYRGLFDARIWAAPSRKWAAEQFLWREQDAIRNSLAMLAQSKFSPKRLHGLNRKAQYELLLSNGVDWNDLEDWQKRGTFVRKRLVRISLSEEALKKIPEKFRPSGPVTRSVVASYHIPPLKRITNLEEVLFDDADPQYVPEEWNPISTQTVNQPEPSEDVNSVIKET